MFMIKLSFQTTKPYVTSGISNASPAHVGEYLIKDTKLVGWDKITENLSYWFGGNLKIKDYSCYS
jgi:hypothetical protein